MPKTVDKKIKIMLVIEESDLGKMKFTPLLVQDLNCSYAQLREFLHALEREYVKHWQSRFGSLRRAIKDQFKTPTSSIYSRLKILNLDYEFPPNA